jgi:hypothetical protein
MDLYSDAYSVRTAPLSQVGRLQVRTTHCDLQQVTPVAPTYAASLATRRPCSRTDAKRTLTHCRGWYHFIEPGGMKGLVGLSTCSIGVQPLMFCCGGKI